MIESPCSPSHSTSSEHQPQEHVILESRNAHPHYPLPSGRPPTSANSSRTVSSTPASLGRNETPDSQLSNPHVTPEIQPHPPDALETNPRESPVGTVLCSKFRQLRWAIILCFIAIPLSILVFYYVYESLVSQAPHLGPLLFSPSRTLLVAVILAQSLGLLIKGMFETVFEGLRWQLAARRNGVGMATFLGLSNATSLLGAFNLLRLGGIGNHIPGCLHRYPQSISELTLD
jgi:hypothetical protein